MFLLTLALADEAGSLPEIHATRTFRVAVTIDAADGPGPVWSWETVEIGPCTGELTEAVRSTGHRRWTWLSERDGLSVGVCGDDTSYEVRLEGDPRRAPQVQEVVLDQGEHQLVLERRRGRWVGDALLSTAERRDLVFEPDAEARYRATRDAIEEAAQDVGELLTSARGWDDPVDGLDGPLFDGADWDMWLDGPDGFGSGVGLGVFDVDDL